MDSLREKGWVWGYVLSDSGRAFPSSKPWDVSFVGSSRCSLETAAAYLGISQVVVMNNLNAAITPEYLKHVAGCRQVIWGLDHADYLESAKVLSPVSKQYPNIVGGIIDDFLEYHGPSKAMKPEDTRAVREALKQDNEALKLYVVQYTWQDANDLLPHLPYIDAINLWVWVGNTYDWQVKMDFGLEQYKAKTDKPILLGMFLHDYGGTGGPMAMDILELQTKKAVQYTKNGLIDGFVILQSGWFDQESHRPQIQWVKQYLDWAFGTESTRAHG